MEYKVNKLAKLAGVTVRTLHVYDKIGLLVPGERTETGYRMYGKEELLRLQQILFYRELGIPLKQIKEILDNPDFDYEKALHSHRNDILKKQKRLENIINTIDDTLHKIKKGDEMKAEELYKGFQKEKADQYRKEARDLWGDEAVRKSEDYLTGLGKKKFEGLQSEFKEIWNYLAEFSGTDPFSDDIQAKIERHYLLVRQFWGTAGSPQEQYNEYAGLGDLYISNERYTMTDGKPNPEFADFMNRAMKYFAKKKLNNE